MRHPFESVDLVVADWTEDAACRTADPEHFFPEHGASEAVAKAICGGCAVSARCLEQAMLADERHGIWGGRSERERRNVCHTDDAAVCA